MSRSRSLLLLGLLALGCRGAAASASPPARADSAVDAMTLRDAAGQSHGFAAVRRDVTVIALWASYCESCQRALPLLEQAAQRHRDAAGIGFVAIGVEESAVVPRARAKLAALAPSLAGYYADEARMIAPLLPRRDDDRPVIEVPAVLIIDRDDRIYTFEQPDRLDELDALLARAAAGTLPHRPNDERKLVAMEVRLVDGSLQVTLTRLPSRRSAAVDAVVEIAGGFGVADTAELRAAIEAQLDAGRVVLPLPPAAG